MINNSFFLTVKKKIKTVWYSGNKYECPICSYKARSLYKIGFEIPILEEKQVIGAGRRNAGCYNCNSNDRERLIFIYLREKLKLFNQSKNITILHLAPEKNISNALLKHGFKNYVCGDLFTAGYTYPSYVQNMNVLDIPFNDNHFDLIICNHLLEHVDDDIKAMKELNRVLKKGGKAILQVPISKTSKNTFEDFTIEEPSQREINFGQFDHVRIYGQDYIDRLISAGFSVDRLNISFEYPTYGLAHDEEIFTCTK